jgi:hypothetical protein
MSKESLCIGLDVSKLTHKDQEIVKQVINVLNNITQLATEYPTVAQALAHEEFSFNFTPISLDAAFDQMVSLFVVTNKAELERFEVTVKKERNNIAVISSLDTGYQSQENGVLKNAHYHVSLEGFHYQDNQALLHEAFESMLVQVAQVTAHQVTNTALEEKPTILKLGGLSVEGSGASASFYFNKNRVPLNLASKAILELFFYNSSADYSQKDYFAKNRCSGFVSWETMCNAVTSDGDQQLVRSHVSILRKKLRLLGLPHTIVCVKGEGYFLTW